MKKKVRWSDGKPVTAKDLEYAYEILANPKVQTTQYTSSLENIKGMAEYHRGKLIIFLVLKCQMDQMERN